MQEIPSGKDGPILPARVAYTKKQDSLYLVVHATESSYCLDLSCMFYGIIFFRFYPSTVQTCMDLVAHWIQW